MISGCFTDNALCQCVDSGPACPDVVRRIGPKPETMAACTPCWSIPGSRADGCRGSTELVPQAVAQLAHRASPRQRPGCIGGCAAGSRSYPGRMSAEEVPRHVEGERSRL